MARRTRRTWKPEVVGLESRAVMTVVSPLAFGQTGLRAVRASQAALNQVAGHATPAAANSVTGFDGNAANFQIGGNPSPAPIDPTLLSPAGIRRATFLANIKKSPYAVSPSSFVGELKTVYFAGEINSNQFLHGTLDMRIDIPDLSTHPTGLVVGIASLRNRNVAATGTVLQVDLFADPSTLDQFGRPTKLGWSVDDNGSGGTYAGAAGSGTVTITYGRAGHAQKSAGVASVTFSGLVLANGTADITAFTLGKI